MCGGQGDHYISLDLSIDDLCHYCRNNLKTMFIFGANGQHRQFIDARERYFTIITELKVRFREVPLNFLVELSEETEAFLGIMDPDNIAEISESISDAAKKEIHRRTLQQFTTLPKKSKIDPSYLGFPRKPKF